MGQQLQHWLFMNPAPAPAAKKRRAPAEDLWLRVAPTWTPPKPRGPRVPESTAMPRPPKLPEIDYMPDLPRVMS